jgi:hypothetical protein
MRIQGIRRKVLFIVFIALVVGSLGMGLFGGCEAGKSRHSPRWVRTGETGKYPSSGYLLGIGSARDTGNPDEDRKAADEAAHVNLASQIKVKVDSELSTRVAEKSKYGGDGSETHGIQEVESLVRSRVDLELSGVEFVERYYNPAEKVYYTLAVLDRLRSAAGLRQEIAKLRLEGRHYYDEAEVCVEKGELCDALRALNHSLDALAEAEAKEAVLSVIEGMPLTGPPDELSPWQVGARKDEVKSRFRYLIKMYEINPFSPKSDLAESKLVTRLNELGLNAVHSGDVFADLSYRELLNAPAEYLAEQIRDRAYFLIVGEVEAKRSSKTLIGKNMFYFYKSRADVKMLNVRTGKVLFTVAFDWEEATKAGKSREEQASALSLEKAGELIAGLLASEMQEYLDGASE